MESESKNSYSDNVEKMFNQFIPTLEFLFGKKLSKVQRREIEDKLSELIGPSLNYAKNVDKIKKTGDKAQIAEISEDYIKEIISGIPKGTLGMEYIRDTLFKTEDIGIEYIKRSKYDVFIKTIREIIKNKIVAEGMDAVSLYKDSIDNAGTENLNWAQPIVIDIRNIVKYRTRDRKRFSIKLAMRCVSEYGKLSGLYERLIVMVAGFTCIERDNHFDFAKFRKRGLSQCLRLINAKEWSVLTQDFNILIRNSVAHKSYIFDPVLNVIKFTDPISGKEETISNQEMFEKTRELSCLILALGKFRGFIEDETLSYLISNFTGSKKA
jgi:hypothetical protein